MAQRPRQPGAQVYGKTPPKPFSVPTSTPTSPSGTIYTPVSDIRVPSNGSLMFTQLLNVFFKPMSGLLQQCPDEFHSPHTAKETRVGDTNSFTCQSLDFVYLPRLFFGAHTLCEPRRGGSYMYHLWCTFDKSNSFVLSWGVCYNFVTTFLGGIQRSLSVMQYAGSVPASVLHVEVGLFWYQGIWYFVLAHVLDRSRHLWCRSQSMCRYVLFPGDVHY